MNVEPNQPSGLDEPNEPNEPNEPDEPVEHDEAEIYNTIIDSYLDNINYGENFDIDLETRLQDADREITDEEVIQMCNFLQPENKKDNGIKRKSIKHKKKSIKHKKKSIKRKSIKCKNVKRKSIKHKKKSVKRKN